MILPPTSWDRFSFAWGTRTFIMGIINVTPDSFSGDGLARSDDPGAWASAAAEQARRMVAEGADILDVGGASSRPGAMTIDPTEEIARVVPVIDAIRSVIPSHIPVSIDTTHVLVARAALNAGAHLINDITGLADEPALATLAAEAGVPVILMANMRGIAKTSIVSDVTRYLGLSIERALDAGIPWEHIIIDPGFGFGTTPAENVAIVQHMASLHALQRPILLGVSRKSTIGALLGDLPVEDRLEGSLAAAVLGVERGAAIVRVHDVQATKRAVLVADAIVRG